MEGFIKLLRQILDWRWFRDPHVAHLFVYLLLRANYTDAEWQDIVIKRGQLVTSRDTLVHETGLTESMVKRGLRVLKRTGEIQTMSTNQYTVVTIAKYDEYQGNICNGNQTTSSEEPTVDLQTTTRKEYKNGRKQQPSSPQPPLGFTDTGYNDYDFSFVETSFGNAFYRWLRYRKEQFKFLYKSQDSLQTCYTKLVKLAGNDPLKAMAIVEQSIANSWKGLFELNDYKNGTNTQQSIGDRIRRDAAKAAEFSRKLDQERRANVCSGDSAEVWEP
jgi:hypothetical protein